MGHADLGAALVDAVWPPRCALCGAQDEGDGLGCAEHRFETGLPGPRCGRCAAAIAPVLPDGTRCPDCRARAPGFARVAALGAYRSGANGTWLLALKYGGRADLAAPLGALLAARLAAEPVAESSRQRLLVPVPLHAARRFERGYDQAWQLARHAAEAAGLTALRALRRVRSTPMQGALGTVSRSANVRGAFAPARSWLSRTGRIAGAEVWLVDDVVTSGSTAAECARILRRLGAAHVGVLCVARA